MTKLFIVCEEGNLFAFLASGGVDLSFVFEGYLFLAEGGDKNVMCVCMYTP